MSCIFGNNRDIFFPKLNQNLNLISLSDIAIKYLEFKGYEAYLCKNEEEARFLAKKLPNTGKWPCLFTISDTTGEKEFEEFYTKREVLDMEKFCNIGIIENKGEFDQDLLDHFNNKIDFLKSENTWNKKQIIDLFIATIPNFNYRDIGKYLDSKM